MTREQRLEQDGAINPLLFYRPQDPHGDFSNFSRHQIWMPSPWTGLLTCYETGEHRYQAMKSNDEEGHDYVLEVDNPGAAQRRGRQVNLRAGWGEKQYDLCWYVMVEVVFNKTLQHKSIADQLFVSNGRFIYEDSPTDDIWGWRNGPDHRGRNLLGLSWMNVRGLFLS